MELNDFANLFKSLSEPVRLRILYLLLERGELCVCDIVNSLELSQSVVSRHLAYLRNSGLVSTRREGVWIYYQLIKNCSFVDQLLQQFRTAGASSISLKYDLERLQAEGNGRDCC
jgi:ArsR family transcriptional regulator